MKYTFLLAVVFATTGSSVAYIALNDRAISAPTTPNTSSHNASNESVIALTDHYEGERSRIALPKLVWITSRGTPHELQTALAAVSPEQVAAIRVANGRGLPHAAVSNEQHPEVIRVLADANVNLDAQDNNGRTALHYAINSNNTAATHLLVKHGASLAGSDVENSAGLSPLEFCEGVLAQPYLAETDDSCRLVVDAANNPN